MNRTRRKADVFVLQPFPTETLKIGGNHGWSICELGLRSLSQVSSFAWESSMCFPFV